MLINFEQKIDPQINGEVTYLCQKIEQTNIAGIRFLIPAYCSLTVGYEPSLITFQELVEKIKHLEKEQILIKEIAGRKLRVPVCYEEPYALDLKELSIQKGLTCSEIIALHCQQIYKVYLLGFLPGFTYMGKLLFALQCDRKATPRLRVPANSVGIAGLQTGIYPSDSPGGWQIIGQTPLKIFNPNLENPFLFKAGDEVQFYPISKEEFKQIQKKNNFNLSDGQI